MEECLSLRIFCSYVLVCARMCSYSDMDTSVRRKAAHEQHLVRNDEQLKKLDGLLLSTDGSPRHVRRGMEGNSQGRQVVQNRRIVSSCSSLDPVGRHRNL